MLLELEFTKDFATYKVKDRGLFKSSLASLIIKQKAAKLVKDKHRDKK